MADESPRFPEDVYRIKRERAFGHGPDDEYYTLHKDGPNGERVYMGDLSSRLWGRSIWNFFMATIPERER